MRRRCLPRPLHAAFCVLSMVLILAIVRLCCGPFAALSPEAWVRRLERQSLLPPGEIEARWDRGDFTYLALRQPGGAWRVYGTVPKNTVTYAGPEMKPKGFRLLRFYQSNTTWYVSRDEVPWKGTSFFSHFWEVSDAGMQSIMEAHLLFENEDPAVQRAVFRCTSVSEREGEAFTFQWQAASERLTSRLFDLTLTMAIESASPLYQARQGSLFTIAAGGVPNDTDVSVSLEGEVIWQDGEGRELYREKIGFFSGAGEAGS